jgi:predicted nucleic acid-binding Zn ribbon protein
MDRQCEGCRKPFKPIKPNQKFCSQRCARKVSFARYVQRKATALTLSGTFEGPQS